MSVPSIPKEYFHHLIPDKPFDVDSTVEATLNSNVQVSGKLDTDNVLKLKGDASEPVATDSKVEILNLPRFTLQDIKDMMKVRVHIPNYSNVCFKVFGVEMFSVC